MQLGGKDGAYSGGFGWLGQTFKPSICCCAERPADAPADASAWRLQNPPPRWPELSGKWLYSGWFEAAHLVIFMAACCCSRDIDSNCDCSASPVQCTHRRVKAFRCESCRGDAWLTVRALLRFLLGDGERLHAQSKRAEFATPDGECPARRIPHAAPVPPALGIYLSTARALRSARCFAWNQPQLSTATT